MRKIVIIGATGTIGQAVSALLAKEHQVTRVGNSRGEYTVDLSYNMSIEQLFKRTKTFDALICTAGSCRFGNVNEAGVKPPCRFRTTPVISGYRYRERTNASPWGSR